MTEEHAIQNKIRLALKDTCVMFRMNVGAAYTLNGNYFKTGVPKGFSDLFGFRKSDGKAIFIEVKTSKGKVSAEQLKFIEKMVSNGAVAGVCRSAEEAVKLVNGG